jgi:ribosomal-protein-alanine N-acetyltransferase
MISTVRLELVPATTTILEAALAADGALATALAATLPGTWPPGYYDRSVLEYTLARLREGPEQAGWWMYFLLERAQSPGAPRTLLGTGGFKGPPSADGTVEVGYAIVSEYQRRGYATEAVRGLLAHAFNVPGVQRVIAETLPELSPSIGVLEKTGFRLIGEGSESGVIRFELRRANYVPPPD